MTRTAIIAAMPGELKPFIDQNAKEGWVHEKRGTVHLWRLVWPDQGEWIAACAGAGVDAATRAFAAAEKGGRIDRVVSVGWAGALHAVMEPGQVYSVCGVIDARTGEMNPAADWKDDIWVVTSPIVANEAEKRRLAAAYDVGLVDMEAAAVARLAAMRNIPFYCIKGVSDGFNEKLPDFNRFISATGQFRAGRFIFYALLTPWHWPALMRMGENSKRAAEGIAAALLKLLEHSATRERNGDSNH
jgi:adenosylhomocysteine nucleosidase